MAPSASDVITEVIPSGDWGQVKPIALLPAFIPNSQEPEYSESDRALVDAYLLQRREVTGAIVDNIVEFKRPLRANRVEERFSLSPPTTPHMRVRIGRFLKEV